MPKPKTKKPAEEMVSVPKAALCGLMALYAHMKSDHKTYTEFQKMRGEETITWDCYAKIKRAIEAQEREKGKK